MRPRVLSVSLNVHSPALDYGWKRLVACGTFSTIVLFDPTFARCVQSLQGHRNMVCIVSWAPENYHHDYKDPPVLRLASADVEGEIIVWDVVRASVLSEFRELGSKVTDLQWLQNQHVSRDFMLVLHSESTCILWNTQTQTQLWRVALPMNFTSFSMNPCNSKHLLLQNQSSVIVVQDFSLTTPFKVDIAAKPLKFPAQTSRTISSRSLLQFSINELEGTVMSSGEPNAHSPCIQTCFHGYKKDCFLLLHRRSLFIVNYFIHKPVASITIDRTVSSFSALYSCSQRDVIICLHENGSLSVYARQGLVKPQETVSSPPICKSIECDGPYELVAMTEGVRRTRRNSPACLTVDRARELAFAVTSPDGRLQFWQLSSLPLQPMGIEQLSVDPPWCLSDIVPHEPGLIDLPKLCLKMTSMYTSSKFDPTVCRVCPQHFLDLVSDSLDGRALVAVGNSRGWVQIWDMESGRLWREYHLIPVAVQGIEWFIHNTQLAPVSKEHDLDSSNENSNSSTDRHLLQLGLIVHGFQPRDKASFLLDQPTNSTDSSLEGRNHLLLVHILTGYAYNLRESSIASDMVVGGFDSLTVCSATSRLASPTSTRRNSNSKSESAYENPIDLVRVSHLGQYLAILVRGECLEIWNLVSLTPIPFSSTNCAVAFDWYQSASKQTSYQTLRYTSEALSIQTQPEPESVWPPSPRSAHAAYERESLIFCTNQGKIRLLIVDGSRVDSTAVSESILNGLPSVSFERLSAVAWFADLIAFGTADGYIALRDLESKKTLIRTTSSAGWSVDQSGDNQSMAHEQSKQGHPSLSALMGFGRFNTGVRRLCFLPGSSTSFRLLALMCDSIYIFQPHGMDLSCMARLSGQLQRCLISADWAQPSSNSMDPPMCILVGGDGALRLLQAGESSVEMTSLIAASAAPADSNSSLNNSSAERTITRFFGSSSIPDRIEGQTPLLVPSILSTPTILTIRHLLQHQPWYSTDEETLIDFRSGDQEDPAAGFGSFELACPKLTHGFEKVHSSAHAFLRALNDRTDIRTKFLRPDATVAERCLWTAQLLSDTYETRFWHVAVHCLLDCQHPKGILKTKYSLDSSWGLLAENWLYLKSIMNRIELLEQNQSDSNREYFIHQLFLLGNHDRAVSLLLDTPPNDSNYLANMYRACLVASNSQVRHPVDNLPNQTEDTYLSTVKLVATNLLSHGNLDMGIELLCLINLYPDACRYLQSFGLWEEAISLAKCMLEPHEMNKVIHIWAAHLASPEINQKDCAVLIYVLLKEHNKALKLLQSLDQHQLAARYLEACLQLHVLNWSDEPDELYHEIFFEFCNILTKLGHQDSAKYYCNLSGRLGRSKMRELEIMYS